MSRRISLFAGLTLALLAPAALCAQDDPAPQTPDAPAISTSASTDYPPVSCTCADAPALADTLQLASDTRDRLSEVLRLGPTWRFPVHIRIMTPDDPLLAKINHSASAVFAQGTTMKIEAVVPSTDPNLREFIQRQFVTALLWERFFANTKTFDKDTHLDVVPVWLLEGLREWVNEDPEHNRDSIVHHAVEKQSAPTLEEVTGWHELSDDRLLGLWQRAFCYYLVDSITRQGEPRDDFQQWLDGFTGANPAPAQFHFPTEQAWQRELVDASSRSHARVYTWEETMAQLSADQTVTYAPSKNAKVETFAIYDATTLPHTPVVFEALQERIYVLTELELRSHASWNPVIELYRAALTALIKDNQVDRAQKLLQEGHRLFVEQTAEHQKLVDYVNWFEVTKDYSNPTHFGSYFSTAQEMERIQADPAHPNPIRANLLQIESEL